MVKPRRQRQQMKKIYENKEVRSKRRVNFIILFILINMIIYLLLIILKEAFFNQESSINFRPLPGINALFSSLLFSSLLFSSLLFSSLLFSPLKIKMKIMEREEKVF